MKVCLIGRRGAVERKKDSKDDENPEGKECRQRELESSAKLLPRRFDFDLSSFDLFVATESMVEECKWKNEKGKYENDPVECVVRL